MTELEKALNKLKSGGERITPVSEALLEIIFKNKKPLSSQEMLKELEKKGRAINKTTVYRQLEKLLKHNIVYEIQFEDRNRRYELVADDHHHHLVCTRCGKVEDISLPADLVNEEKEIWDKNKFKVARHSLEFFGLCEGCQNK